ncbi:cytochrome c oxidase subunit II [Microbacterium album]|uniref:cytochrome-c oxidase n=1 Tax=Microbacterium album TaxID=2053191 RepID=A0A917IIK1_9MICO|nr:cytochrome c oxidase subunit II [Microbacterium album]GGH47972.1 cytochrome c oxidase subunit II [Microbacterium album]
MSSRARGFAAAGAVSAAAFVTACAAGGEQQSILDPAGSHAEAIHGLWSWMLGIGAAVWVIVVVAMVVALARRRGDEGDPTAPDAPHREAGVHGRPVRIVAVAGALVPAVIIAVVLAMSTLVQRQIADADVADSPMIEVVGHQYWWEVNYPERGVVTANEIHIPAGERVRLDVSSQDVIHSFWVPELGGKIDMLPGASNSIWLEASEPGVYWGQCAEYCGEQHALMRIVVVAHEPDEFEGWVEAQLRTPPSIVEGEESPGDELIARGREVFLSSSCVYCHAVAGSAALGEVGPDLTHLASRQTLAAGTLPNDRANLSAWLLDPQAIKPGNLMPGTEFDDPADLDALLAYLQSLE